MMKSLLRHLLQIDTRGTSATALAAFGSFCVRTGQALSSLHLFPGWSTGRSPGPSTRRSEPGTRPGTGFGPALFLLLTLLLPIAAPAATLPGTPLRNQASLDFLFGGVPGSLPSNQTLLMVRSQATIEFLRYAPALATAEAVPVATTWYDNGGSFVAMPLPAEAASQPVPLVVTGFYHSGDTLFIRLTDLDQNLDPALAETVLVTVSCPLSGDLETLRLTETGPGTGVFTGYLPSSTPPPVATDGRMAVVTDARLNASYTDTQDGTDSTTAAALVDPLGRVFDSRSGALLDEVSVTLYDVTNDQPATVFGDDGVSSYPATVITGGTVVDGGGTSYTFPAGSFRFPFIAPGTYRLDVTPPAGFSAPSAVSDAILQALPGSPFTLVTGSRNEPFAIVLGPVVQIDVPIDPDSSGLWLKKQVNRETAAIGDFLQYRLTLENGLTTLTVPQAVIVDRIPVGFRYRRGSTRIAGLGAPDPAISSDGRQLTFPVGDLLPGESREVSYVLEVGAGTPTGDAINLAEATDALLGHSNVARARVRIREDLLRSKAYLAGRVHSGACGETPVEPAGVPGIRVYLEDGTFAVTDSEGRYHFEGVDPGSHVVQVDTTTLPTGYEMRPCELTSRAAGRSFSQFVDLQGGTLWQVDFLAGPIPPPTGEVTLKLSSQLTGSEGHFAIDLTNTAVAVDNLRLTVMLPGDAVYVPGSSRIDAQPLADPSVSGGAVSYKLPAMAAGARQSVTFSATLGRDQKAGELPAKALLQFDSPSARNQRTPIAETRFRLDETIARENREVRLYPHFPSFVADLQTTDRAMLEQLIAELQEERVVRLDIVGHTDSQRIAARSRSIHADNRALSLARARSVADILGAGLGLPAAAVTIRGLGESMPVADNSSAAGMALNRRVEVYIVSEKLTRTTTLEVLSPASPPQSAATRGVSPAEKTVPTVPVAAIPALPQPPQIDEAWLAATSPGTRLVWPPEGYIPPAPSTRILVQHQPGEKVEVMLNGSAVSPLNFEGVQPAPGHGVAVSSWRGVDLLEGDNRLDIRVTSAAGNQSFSRAIRFSSTPQSATLREDLSTLVADGITPPVIAVRLLDAAGQPVRPGLYADISVAPPYLAQQEKVDNLATDERSGPTGRPRFATGADGVVYLPLSPTSQAGAVSLTVHFTGHDQEVQTWLKPAPRDWILVGLAEGTVGYNNLSGHIEDLPAGADDEGLYESDRLAFFAKGQVKGEWLLTLAYDSDKPNRDGQSLRQTIDPDAYYTLYGDATEQGYEAASARKLYVKLERDQFVALFGDYDTGLTVTELSRYSRSLSGLKVDWHGDRGELRAFASDTGQNFVKDELRGDGTSGLYRLTKKALVLNSEKVTIEVRDRFHSERILESRSLNRHIDYEIDYNAATLFFKQPVLSRDSGFNPIWIVVDYEIDGGSSSTLSYGGRGALRFLDRALELGASTIHEDQGTRQGDLFGLDVDYRLGTATTLRAEIATSQVDSGAGDVSGNAYLAELRHSGRVLDGRLFYREEGDDFGLGQQAGSESGTRKFGVDANYRLSPDWRISAQAFRERMLASGNERTLGEASAFYQHPGIGTHFGLRQAIDSQAGGDSGRSTQALVGAFWQPGGSGSRWTLRADHEQSIAGSNGSADYPTRTTLGSDFRLTDSTLLFAEQEFTSGEQRSNSTRAGFKTTPWQGGALNSALGRQVDGGSERIFALVGLQQSWQLTQRWAIDATLDRSQTVHSVTPLNPKAPPASGDGTDYTAVTLGATYKLASWSWWNRVEYRTSDTDDKWGVSSGLYGQLREDLGITTRLQAFLTESADGSRSDNADLRFGVAWRPLHSRWILLDRLDLLADRQSGSTFDQRGWRIVNNLNLNRRFGRSTQLSLQYAAKYVLETIDDSRYTGYTDLLGIEGRYNLSERWDIGAYAGVLHSWSGGQYQYRLGASVGCQVITNAWVSLGYNLLGFTDPDFSAAEYTAEGPYLRFRLKFDQASATDLRKLIDTF